jgi:hypothetical protein
MVYVMDAKYGVNNVYPVVRSDGLFGVRIDPNSLCRARERDFSQFLVKYTARRHLHFDEILMCDVALACNGRFP